MINNNNQYLTINNITHLKTLVLERGLLVLIIKNMVAERLTLQIFWVMILKLILKKQKNKNISREHYNKDMLQDNNSKYINKGHKSKDMQVEKESNFNLSNICLIWNNIFLVWKIICLVWSNIFQIWKVIQQHRLSTLMQMECK